MKIADLERATGVGRSTIHHYLNLGLLPEPRVEGPKLHVFGAVHVERLREIRRLRSTGASLEQIRERVGRRVERRRAAVEGRPMEPARSRIVERATELFAERGYDGVRLSEVARDVGVGKATLYRHFPSKLALFVDCVERVRFTLIPKDVRELNDRASPDEQGRNRAAAVLANFSAFRTLSNLLGSVAHGRDPELAAKARKELHDMVTNAVPLLVRLIDAGAVRPVDPELLAYMLWFSLMGAGERMTLDDELSLPDVLEAYLEFVSYGIRRR